MVEQRGIEPLTSALRTRRSAKLSYCPTGKSILQFQVSSFKFGGCRQIAQKGGHKKAQEAQKQECHYLEACVIGA